MDKVLEVVFRHAHRRSPPSLAPNTPPTVILLTLHLQESFLFVLRPGGVSHVALEANDVSVLFPACCVANSWRRYPVFLLAEVGKVAMSDLRMNSLLCSVAYAHINNLFGERIGSLLSGALNHPTLPNSNSSQIFKCRCGVVCVPATCRSRNRSNHLGKSLMFGLSV